jgi:uncharacterized protein YciI
MADWIYFLHPPREDFAATMTEPEREVWGRHFARLQQLFADGVIVLVGPTLGRHNTGICVFEAPDEAAAQAIVDADRYPSGEAVNFSKLPIDLGIIHYASDTPYTQARTLGARGLSYYGMDSTYASSVAILRRIFSLEGLYE